LVDKGLDEVLDRLRNAEASDPYGIRWPRNKKSDDATCILGWPHREFPGD
jgi:hypothetical protein